MMFTLKSLEETQRILGYIPHQDWFRSDLLFSGYRVLSIQNRKEDGVPIQWRAILLRFRTVTEVAFGSKFSFVLACDAKAIESHCAVPSGSKISV